MPPSMDGWLNRHVPGTREGHNWRLVRGTIQNDQFVMRAAPQSVRAFDPALAKPPLTKVQVDLIERLISQPKLLPFCTDLVAAFDIIRKKPAEQIADCVRSCLLPGLLLNDAVNIGLQQLAEHVSKSNDRLSDSLKREIYKAYADASDLLPQPLAPEPSGVVDVRLWQLARVAHQLWLPPDLFADPGFVDEMCDQIHYFHSFFWKRWSPLTDPSVLFHFEGATAAWNLNPLLFDLKTPHFLGSLLLGHVFATTISEQTRGEMLTSWINLGMKLRSRGDIVGWIAIASVICTPAVLRLRNSWSHVPQQLRQTVSREWGFEVFELEKRAALELLQKSTFRASTEEMGEVYPKSACVPYFGDVIISSKPTPEQATMQLERLTAVTEGWLYYFDNALDMEALANVNTIKEPKPYFQELFTSWLRLNRQLPNPLLSASNQSFQIEPRAFGYYLPHFFSQSQPLSVGSFIPILFTEPIPSFRLLSKNALASAVSSRHRGAIGAISKPIRATNLQRSNSFPPLTTGVREIENGPREYLSKNGSPHVLVRAIRDLLNVGVETHLVGLDLVLKSINEQNTSRHSSILEDRHGSTELNRNSVQSLELSAHMANMDIGSVEVVVKAASLQRLVDTLVLGVGEFSTNKQRFKINLPSHTETFMATFRSFCAPPELLKMLETRFFGASEAAFSIVSHRSGQQDDATPFPNWGYTNQPVTGQALRVVSQIYCNILEAVQYWITEFHVDFADDAELTTQMHKFLQDMEQHLVHFEQLPNHAKRLSDTFVKLKYRAPDIVPVDCLPPVSRHVVHLPPDASLAAMEQYLEELDSIVSDHFNAISTVDWMQLFETLELQIADPMFLFNYTPSPTTSEDELQIQDIFSYFGTLFRHNPKDKTFSYFPATVKALFKLHNNITDYFTYQITDPLLHVLNRNRSDRLTGILKMIGILRVRMKFFDLFPNNTDDLSTRVPSFIESAIVAAILKPESRVYAAAWLQAGLDVQQEFEAASSTPMSLGSFDKNSDAAPQRAVPNSFTIFIPKIPTNSLRLDGRENVRPITPCLGWIMERLFEIVCYIPNMAVENPELINFDKRRYAYNLIRNIRKEFQYSAINPKLYTQFDYIVNPEVGLYKLDKRLLKESVARELQGQPKWKQKQKAFTGCVSAELEKMRLEARQYDILVSRTPSITSSSSLTSVSLLEKRLPKIRPISALVNNQPPISSGSSFIQASESSRSSTKSRSRFGSLLKSTVRPLSMAFSSNNINAIYSGGSSSSSAPTGSVINPSNLPSLDASEEKILASLDLSLCEVKGPRKGIFRIVPSKGVECVLQAPSDSESAKWVEVLIDACKKAVAHSQMKPGSTRVFGVPLEIVCQREQSAYPGVVTTLLDRVEEFGLEEVGLYRISGSLAAVNTLKAALDNGERLKVTDDRWIDMNVVAGCVKLYLRELPQPLLGPIFEDLVECANVSKEKQLKMLSDCIHRLPSPNYHLLRRIITHLNLVVQHESVNKMSTPNLAIVFSMNFFPDNAMDRMRPMQSIVNTMIVNQNYLFAESNTSF